MGDLRLLAEQELALRDKRITFVEEFFGGEFSDEDNIPSLCEFEAKLVSLSSAPIGSPKQTSDTAAERTDFKTPDNGHGQRLARKQCESRDAGLDVDWCDDVDTIDFLLGKVRHW